MEEPKMIRLSDKALARAEEEYPVDMQKYPYGEGEYDSNLMPRCIWAAGYDAALRDNNIPES